MTILIRKKWFVDTVLTNVTTVKLSDPTGTYGIKETVSGTKVVNDATAMENSSTGVYDYSFANVTGTQYTAYIEVVYSGSTYYFEVDITGSTTITAPDDPSLCTVQFRVKLGTTAVSGAVCKAQLQGINHATDGTILSNAVSSDTTDASGIAELQLVQKGSVVKGGGVYEIWVEISSKPVSSIKTTIPNQSAVLFEDLL